MKKFIFIACFIFLFLSVVLLSLFGKKTIQVNPPTFPPTPTPIPIENNVPTTNTPILLRVDPVSNDSNVPLDKKITLTFNKPVSQQDISFSLVPSLDITATESGNTYTLSHDQPFSPNTTYTYFVTIKGLPTYTLSFTTVANGISSGATDFSNDIQNETNKHNYPDVFLAQQTPYNTSGFSVASDYSDQTSSYSFTVTYYEDATLAKNDFLSWATSLGLTNQQVEKLQITYHSPTPGF